jgi:NADH:ubiquinone oxidoreductase subunit 5 (subunit L)/multisubunit Na+/H+ antiporter MnhA subunit
VNYPKWNLRWNGIAAGATTLDSPKSSRSDNRSGKQGCMTFNSESLVRIFGTITVGAPLLLVLLLGGLRLLSRPLSERFISRCVQCAVITGLVASLLILVVMLVSDTQRRTIDMGSFVALGDDFKFAIKIEFDRLSVPFAILSFSLCGTIGAFANIYMHRESGYCRFFVLYSIFVLGMTVTSLAGTMETLFMGWEIVGLSSALLVAFFHERAGPVSNGLKVWIVYRVGDAALLLASVVLHHVAHTGDFDEIFGTVAWPNVHLEKMEMGQTNAFVIGMLLLVAAAGKSAMIPFSGWLPRAMEGPTPSSAVFYGALSVHLGAFLLLRVSPILDYCPPVAIAVVICGASSAAFAAFVGRAQTDIKSALSFASITQVGIIFAEIGIACLVPSEWLRLLIRYFALVHILGHGCLRTLQFLRAPTLLHDYHILENAIGDHLPTTGVKRERTYSDRLRWRLYRFAIERGYLDAMLADFIVSPFLFVFRWCDKMERKWVHYLAGPPVPHEASNDAIASMEEML